MCEIRDVRIVGRNLNTAGAPQAYEIFARIQDCNAVSIAIEKLQHGVIFSASPVDVTGSPTDNQGFFNFVMMVENEEPVFCDEEFIVRIVCLADPTCRFEEILSVECGPPDDNGRDGNGWCVFDRWIAISALLLALMLALLALCGVPVGATVITALIAVSLGGFLALSVLCGWGFCEIVGAIAWCFMWGAIIGVVIALICVSLMVLLLALGYGMIAGLLVLRLWARGCPTPHLFSAP